MEKNTLWIFGDSFSWDHKIRLSSILYGPFKDNSGLSNDSTWKYINNYLDGKLFSSWGEIISKHLDFNYVNHASYESGIKIKNLPNGNSNNSSINLIHELSSNFKKGDIVIHGFTDIARFDYSYKSNDRNVLDTILPSTDLTSMNVECIEEILINRTNFDFYIHDELQKLKGIETLSEVVGFDIWYWDWCGYFDKLVRENKIPNDRWIFFQAENDYYDYSDMMYNKYKIGAINWETNNDIDDHHFGKVGHELHAKILIDFLKNR